MNRHWNLFVFSWWCLIPQENSIKILFVNGDLNCNWSRFDLRDGINEYRRQEKSTNQWIRDQISIIRKYSQFNCEIFENRRTHAWILIQIRFTKSSVAMANSKILLNPFSKYLVPTIYICFFHTPYLMLCQAIYLEYFKL